MDGLPEVTTTTPTLIVIASAISIIVGMFLNKGLDAYLKYRADARKDKDADNQRADKGYEFVIGKLTQQCETQDKEIDDLRKRELECIKNQGVLEGRIAALESRLKAIEARNNYLEQKYGSDSTEEIRRKFKAQQQDLEDKRNAG